MTEKLTEEQVELIKKGCVDEMCVCGHLKSQHTDTLAKGHGSCRVCKCLKVTWVKFVF